MTSISAGGSWPSAPPGPGRARRRVLAERAGGRLGVLDGVELVVATRVGPAITLVVAVRSAARAHAVWHEAAVPDVPLRFVEHA